MKRKLASLLNIYDFCFFSPLLLSIPFKYDYLFISSPREFEGERMKKLNLALIKIVHARLGRKTKTSFDKFTKLHSV